MLQGKSPKMKGRVCNLPIVKGSIDCNLLLRPADSNGIVNVKFSFQVAKEVKHSPSKYFNQILLNYSQIFASESDYIFFAPLNMQKVQFTTSVNIALKTAFSPLILSRKVVYRVESLSILFSESLQRRRYTALSIALKVHQFI